jgi:putative FmdB family regulatory protein
MPLYEYQCLNCPTQFEGRRGFDDGSTVTCPQCQGEGQRPFSPVLIILKGPGFYTTDNRKNGSTPEDPGDDLYS